VLFHIPIKTESFPDGFPLYGFGLMLFLAFLACTWLATRRAQQAGIPREWVQDIVIWIFLGGLVGARTVYLLAETDVQTVGEFLKQLPRIWDGGIVFYGSAVGGLIGYLLAYYLVFRKKGLSTLKMADVVAPCVALGLCLGRLGCFLNGCCYGQVACADCAVCPVSFPLSAPARYALVDAGVQTAAGFTLAPDLHAVVDKVAPGSAAYAAGLRPGDLIVKADGQTVGSPEELSFYLVNNWPKGKNDLTLTVLAEGLEKTVTFAPRTVGLHPTQLYEVISMALLLLLLLAFDPFKTRDGQVMALLMIAYGVHRYFNELLRNDPRPIGLESYTSILVVAAGLVFALWLWRRPAQYEPQWAT
jgi:prolipoprotein diacylglyceryltransferase